MNYRQEVRRDLDVWQIKNFGHAFANGDLVQIEHRKHQACRGVTGMITAYIPQLWGGLMGNPLGYSVPFFQVHFPAAYGLEPISIRPKYLRLA